jgi:hypothetical protein
MPLRIRQIHRTARPESEFQKAQLSSDEHEIQPGIGLIPFESSSKIGGCTTFVQMGDAWAEPRFPDIKEAKAQEANTS